MSRDRLRSRVTVVLGLALIVLALVLGLTAETADARAVRVSAPVADYPSGARNPFLYVARVPNSRWFYAQRADNSEWLVTRCRHEDSRNCYWNARVRGNGQGRSFINLDGHIIFTR